MTKFLPLFPLEMIVFPGEELKLHIFEPRYKELINECVETGRTFGIPPLIEKGVAEYGTEVKVVSVGAKGDNGEMDVTVIGLSVYKTLESLKTVPDKLYSAAIVADMENDIMVSAEMRSKLFSQIIKLAKHVKLDEGVLGKPQSIMAFDVANQVGLDLMQKLDILSMVREKDRQTFIIQHLKLTIPIVKQANKLQFRSFLN